MRSVFGGDRHLPLFSGSHVAVGHHSNGVKGHPSTPRHRGKHSSLSRTLFSPMNFLIAAFLLTAYTLVLSHRSSPEALEDLLTQNGRAAFGLDPPATRGPASVLVIYDYQGLDPEDADNLRFFLAVGVSPDDGNHYVVVSREQPTPTDPEAQLEGDEADEEDLLFDPTHVPLPPFENLPPNVQSVTRPNEPCLSAWSTLGWALTTGVVSPAAYEHFILVDSSVRGPFLPAHWPPLVHWSAGLLARLQGSVHMVGATIVTDPALPGPSVPRPAQPRPQPRIRSGIVAFDGEALRAVQSDPEVTRCRIDPADSTWFAESGASAAVLHGGLNLDCLMLRYQNKDWLDRSSWGWKETNSEVDSGPFQVMFVPLRSKSLATSRAAMAAHQYSLWAVKTLKNGGGEGENSPVKKAAPVKKATATDVAKAKMQLDAAAAQAAAMALRQQREEKESAAAKEEEAAEEAVGVTDAASLEAAKEIREETTARAAAGGNGVGSLGDVVVRQERDDEGDVEVELDEEGIGTREATPDERNGASVRLRRGGSADIHDAAAGLRRRAAEREGALADSLEEEQQLEREEREAFRLSRLNDRSDSNSAAAGGAAEDENDGNEEILNEEEEEAAAEEEADKFLEDFHSVAERLDVEADQLAASQEEEDRKQRLTETDSQIHAGAHTDEADSEFRAGRAATNRGNDEERVVDALAAAGVDGGEEAENQRITAGAGSITTAAGGGGGRAAVFRDDAQRSRGAVAAELADGLEEDEDENEEDEEEAVDDFKPRDGDDVRRQTVIKPFGDDDLGQDREEEEEEMDGNEADEEEEEEEEELDTVRFAQRSQDVFRSRRRAGVGVGGRLRRSSVTR